MGRKISVDDKKQRQWSEMVIHYRLGDDLQQRQSPGVVNHSKLVGSQAFRRWSTAMPVIRSTQSLHTWWVSRFPWMICSDADDQERSIITVLMGRKVSVDDLQQRKLPGVVNHNRLGDYLQQRECQWPGVVNPYRRDGLQGIRGYSAATPTPMTRSGQLLLTWWVASLGQ